MAADLACRRTPRLLSSDLAGPAIKLADFPFSARMIPEFQDPDRRETFVYEYRLMYRVEDDRIRILRVVHGRRLLKNVPGSFEEARRKPTSAA